MNQKIKLLTAWLLLYTPLFMIWGLGYAPFLSTNVIIPLHLFSFIASLYLIYSYLKHIMENSKLSSGKKIMWIFAILIFSPISMIIYLLKHGKNTL